MVHIPYKGTIQAVTDLVAGQIQIVFSGMVPAMPYSEEWLQKRAAGQYSLASGRVIVCTGWSRAEIPASDFGLLVISFNR